VLLRGVDVNGLGDYFAVSPALAPVVPLTEQDFADIAKLGMDEVRLIVSWSSIEPQRGAFDAGYLARIRQAVGWAAAERAQPGPDGRRHASRAHGQLLLAHDRGDPRRRGERARRLSPMRLCSRYRARPQVPIATRRTNSGSG
jgi:hypothetical protein